MNIDEKIAEVFAQPFPAEVLIECTGQCNLNCIHCYLGCKENLPLISLETIKNILHQLSKLGTMQIKLSGGEPFCHPQIIPILNEIRSHGMSVTVFTNATLLNEKIIYHIKELVNHVRISIYGASESTYEKVTNQKGMFSRLVKNIDLLHKNNIDMQASIILLKENIHEHQAMYQFCVEHGMSPTTGLRIEPTRNGDNSVCQHEISQDQFLDAVEFIRKINHVENTSTDDCDDDIQKILNRHPCGAGVYSIAIRYNGDVVPCVELGIKYGNIYSTPIKTLYQSDASKFMQKLCMSSFTRCKSCALLAQCSICLGLLYKENGHIFPTQESKVCKDTHLLYNYFS